MDIRKQTHWVLFAGVAFGTWLGLWFAGYHPVPGALSPLFPIALIILGAKFIQWTDADGIGKVEFTGENENDRPE